MAERPPALRVLASLYALFALAAGARSIVQLATQASEAPLPYALSALAAAVYLAGAIALRRDRRRAAVWVCAFELAGVLLVGAWSRLDPGAFADATVWSDFGGGYGHVPLALPIAGLWFLLVARPEARAFLAAGELGDDAAERRE